MKIMRVSPCPCVRAALNEAGMMHEEKPERIPVLTAAFRLSRVPELRGKTHSPLGGLSLAHIRGASRAMSFEV